MSLGAFALILGAATAAAGGEIQLGTSAGMLLPAQASPQLSWTALPRVAWWPGPSWGLALELGSTPGLSLEGHDFQGLEPSLGLALRPWTRAALTTHGELGLALAVHRPDRRLNGRVPTDLSDQHMGAWASLGAAWRATPWLQVRGDLRWNQGLGAPDPHDALTGLEPMLGVDLIQALGPMPGSVASDTDGDGTPDTLDACPHQAGAQASQGCPAPSTPGIRPEDASIWIPHPHCIHAPASGDPEAWATLEPAQRVVVSAPGHLPAFVEARELDDLALAVAPPQGTLVVVASPGDLVLVDRVQVSLGPDGVGVVAVPEGSVEVEVQGGGRLRRGEVAVAQGHATWLRPEPAQQLRLLFPVGSTALDSGQVNRLALLATLRADYSYVLRGQASPEGDQADNLALARARAAVVQQALRDAGVPPSKLVVQEPEPGPTGGDPAQLRSCTVIPIPEPAP
jgi:outer membrane protein OmpA-like peptidoglycan-associated protein